jgi:hypothetical protein
MSARGQVGGFTPDRTREAHDERRRLLRIIAGADRAGYEHVAAELRELDSELFDVTENAPTAWRSPA